MASSVPSPTQKLFDVDLPAALARHAAKAYLELGATFLLTVTGVGAWKVRAVPGEAPFCTRCSVVVPPIPDVSVTIREVDFRILLNSPVKAYTAMQLALTGKMTIEGPQVLAVRLEKLLGYL